MPLAKIEQTKKGGIWGLWNIKESVDELYQILSPKGADADRYKQKNTEKNQKEFLASRSLVSKMLSQLNLQYQGVTRDKNNKPHLIGTDYNISISHSDNYAAAIIDPAHPVGIDIQTIRSKIMDIRERVLSESELADAGNNMVKHTVYWSAKEVLYKIQGRKGINFIDHLKISPFELDRLGAIKTEICKPEVACNVNIEYRLYDNFVLVYSV